ncbi:hypothetical protein SCHPADRAFT_274159 [Schizopora paradoxa]|uniref:DUF6533 domain-containing protein n=1 Tax=Schizopora paradoxa TaxID=27342 RepID=A0A0H2S0H3_9AGAM|nr:hypothetical protein SCHPADRAFT_274159 [Schizopora paradoxa]
MILSSLKAFQGGQPCDSTRPCNPSSCAPPWIRVIGGEGLSASSMSNQPESLPPQDAEYIRLFHNAIVSAAALVLYEYTLTLRNEIRFMWNRRLSFGKVMFFVNRYLPILTVFLHIYTYLLISQSVENTCQILVDLSAVLVYINSIVNMMVLFARAYAVWFLDARIQFILAATLVVGIGGSAYVLRIFVRGATLVPLNNLPYSEYRQGCNVYFADSIEWINYALLIILEMLALTLLIIKSVNNYRHLHSTNAVLRVMIEDGIGYFVCSIAVSAANMAILCRTTVRSQSRSAEYVGPVLKMIFLSYFYEYFCCCTLSNATHGRLWAPLLINVFRLQGVLESILCNRLLLHVFDVCEAQKRHVVPESISMESL